MKKGDFEKWVISKINHVKKGSIRKIIRFEMIRKRPFCKLIASKKGQFEIDHFKNVSLAKRLVWKKGHFEIDQIVIKSLRKNFNSREGHFEKAQLPK